MIVETGHRLAQLEETIAEEDGYVAEPFAAELLSGLGIVVQDITTGPDECAFRRFQVACTFGSASFSASRRVAA